LARRKSNILGLGFGTKKGEEENQRELQTLCGGERGKKGFVGPRLREKETRDKSLVGACHYKKGARDFGGEEGPVRVLGRSMEKAPDGRKRGRSLLADAGRSS